MTFPGRDFFQTTATVPSTVTSSVAGSLNINCGFIPTAVDIINKGSSTGSTLIAAQGSNNNNLQQIFRLSWNTDFGTTLTLAEWFTASNSTVYTTNTTAITSNGILPYNGQVTPASSNANSLVLGTKITGSNTNKATATFTVSSTATLFPGALILMTGNTVNKQLGGMLFTINTIASTTTFTIANGGWLNTANFTTDAETFNVQLVTTPPYYFPTSGQIVNISAANPAVVTTSTNLSLSAGDVVRLRVPSVFGMTQANNVTAIISAVSGNQVTLGGTTGAFTLNNGLNTSAFSPTFSWPAATSVPFSPATLTVIGSGPTLSGSGFYNTDPIEDATLNQSFQGFTIGSGILIGSTTTTLGVTAGDVLSIRAWRADQ